MISISYVYSVKSFNADVIFLDLCIGVLYWSKCLISCRLSAKIVGSLSRTNVSRNNFPYTYYLLTKVPKKIFVSKFCVGPLYFCRVFLMFMIQNDELTGKSRVFDYYSKWLGKHVSKIVKKIQENKFDIFFMLYCYQYRILIKYKPTIGSHIWTTGL